MSDDVYLMQCHGCLFHFESTDYHKVNEVREGHLNAHGHRSVMWVQPTFPVASERPSRASDALYADMLDDDWI